MSDIITHDDYAEIEITNRKNETTKVIIDLDDVDKVKQYNWCILKSGYVVNGTNGLYLHRYIMDCNTNEVVDHINNDKLNNKKSNLRVCKQSDNAKNKSKSKKNTTGVTGVYIDKRTGKYYAIIQYNYKQIYLGTYETIEGAIEARKQAEIEYFGEYRNMN